MKPTISIVVAISENRVIGRDNKLPWHIPEDLKRFKELTLNHPIIMGRKTYESIGRPLPQRTNIVITRDKNYHVEGLVVVHSIEEAIQKSSKIDQEEIFIIGGGKIFEQSLHLTDKICLTIVHKIVEGDVYFPEYRQFTKETFRKEHLENNPPFTFVNLER